MSLFDDNLLSVAHTPVVAPVAAFTGLGDDTWLDASKALEGIAAPIGMVRPFLPWQAAAYNYANDSIARWGGALLGDDMGMGKTQVLQALAMDAVRTLGAPAIVIAPTVAEAGYRSDLFAAFPSARMHVVRGRKVVTLPDADLYFISDDPLTLKAWLTIETTDVHGKKHLAASAWALAASLIIRDEIHRDKGNQGKPSVRSRVLLAVGAAVRQAGRAVVGATGTLLTNRPVEAYLPLQIIGGETLLKALTPGANKASAFLWRYCAPVQVHIGKGQHRTNFNGVDIDTCHVLHENLRRTIYVRREKGDLPSYCANGHTNPGAASECNVCGLPVVPVLPHSGWVVAPLALPFDKMVTYDRAVRDMLNLIKERSGVEAMWRAEKGKALVQMQLMWQEAGKAKAEAAVDYIANLVDQGDQVVAFYQHTDVMTHMMTALIKANVSFNIISGNVTGAARTDAVDEFQASGVQVCLAQIQSAGQSVTLTAAPHAVFVQVPWSAGQIAQCAGRILRVDEMTRARARAGGKVTWHVLQAAYENGDSSFDMQMWDVLEGKAQVCDAVNAGREITMPQDSIWHEMLTTWEPQARKRAGGW